MARINALISFYTQFRVLPNFFKKCVQNHIEASLSRSGQARHDGSLWGMMLPACRLPTHHASGFRNWSRTQTLTASLLSLMWSAMPQKNWNFWVHFLGPENEPEFVPRGQKRDPKSVPEPGVTKSMFFHTKSELYLAESDTKTSKLIVSMSGFIPTGSTQMHVPNDPPKRQL